MNYWVHTYSYLLCNVNTVHVIEHTDWVLLREVNVELCYAETVNVVKYGRNNGLLLLVVIVVHSYRHPTLHEVDRIV
jgi:hypothetical protein